MNLYELAHHPNLWNDWTNKQQWIHVSTQEQFKMLNYPEFNGQDFYNVSEQEDENEFRMHLLFVYFATTPESEWPV